MTSKHTILIKGGGLWGSLLAYALFKNRPNQKFKLIESEASFGGNHTWCFHQSDISKQSMTWLRDFVVKSWDGYDVAFPNRKRALPLPYHAISSHHLSELLIRTLPPEYYALNEKKGDSSTIVFDARGLVDGSASLAYQKFVGLDVELESPHGLTKPILMDATVEQKDGFRFIYFLPWSETKILIEDTRYSDTPEIDFKEFKDDILKVIESRGWKLKTIHRTEEAALPIPLSEIKELGSEDSISLAGIFHDTTGYSLPDAVRLIQRIIELKEISPETIREAVSNYRQERSKDRSFFRLLNRLLFKAGDPKFRYKMLEHFYGKPQSLISRFYSGQMSKLERMRFFIGFPPVPVFGAIGVFLKKEQKDFNEPHP